MEKIAVPIGVLLFGLMVAFGIVNIPAVIVMHCDPLSGEGNNHCGDNGFYFSVHVWAGLIGSIATLILFSNLVLSEMQRRQFNRDIAEEKKREAHDAECRRIADETLAREKSALAKAVNNLV